MIKSLLKTGKKDNDMELKKFVDEFSSRSRFRSGIRG